MSNLERLVLQVLFGLCGLVIALWVAWVWLEAVSGEETLLEAPKAYSEVLGERAEQRAAFLCDTDSFSHNGWISSFEGLGYQHMGENLARGFDSYRDIKKAWANSPTHRANLENTDFTEYGIGIGDCGTVVELYAG